MIAGLYHETNTFVPGRTTWADFSTLIGTELLRAEGEPSPLGGALEAARGLRWTVLPAVDCRAQPSGTVDDAVPTAWWAKFREAADAALRDGPLDGLFLVLHGAMATETCRDVEGDLLERIRAVPGLANTPIAGVTDLHANVSERMADLSNALITYRCNPHTDAHEIAIRAAGTLDRLMATDRPARTYRAQPPLILPPTATGTDDEPMRTLEAMARQMEEDHDILAVNVHPGFSFADTPDTGVSFTINTLGDEATTCGYLEELCQAALRLPTVPSNPEISLAEAMARLATFDSGPVLLVEPSDNIGAGAPGAGVAILKALVEGGVENAGVIVNDPEAVTALAGCARGERRTLEIGARSSPLYGGGVTLEIELVSRNDGRFRLEDAHSHMASMLGSNVEMGPCALVRHRGVLILLTSRPTAPFDLAQWRSQGVAPEGLFAIGVKAAVAHRQAYDPIARATIYVATPGPCATDLRTLPYRHVRRPIRPLDDL
jgi:microcystin degradation protein MlrC